MLSPPANRGEESVNPRTTPILGLRPLNPGSAPKGDNLCRDAAGLWLALRSTTSRRGGRTHDNPGPTLHFGPTSQPCARSISHLKELGGDGGQGITPRPSPADSLSQDSL